MADRIPCTVITGFLGAGKTTLIQSLMQNPAGRRIALIVNEFGDIGVDGDLIASCGIEGCDDDDVIELSNGCICCTVADDFLPTLTRLLERETPPDHIVIETSGLALPQPLLRAFAWPEVRTRTTVDAVIAVIDSDAVAQGRFAADEAAVDRQRAADDNLDHQSPLSELFEDQLTCADLIVLSKTDLIDAAQLADVTAIVSAKTRPAAKLIHSGAQRPSAEILLGVAAGAETDAANRKTLHEAKHHNHDKLGDARHAGSDHDHSHHHHDHDHDHHDHDHDAFETFVVAMPTAASPHEVSARVARLTADPSVLRVKGAVRIDGKPMRLVVQAVGPRIATHYDRPWRAHETGDGQLVVICLAGSDRAALTANLMDHAA